MNIICPFTTFDLSRLSFFPVIRIEENEYVIKYNTGFFVTNGYTTFIECNMRVKLQHYNNFDIEIIDNIEESHMDQIITIERDILQTINILNKTPLFSLRDEINMKKIKVFTEKQKIYENVQFKMVLRLSSVWENEINYGIKYKFYI